MSSSKPILSGGVAGSKYLPYKQQVEQSKNSPITGPPSSGMNNKARDSMSLNHSGVKNKNSRMLSSKQNNSQGGILPLAKKHSDKEFPGLSSLQ